MVSSRSIAASLLRYCVSLSLLVVVWDLLLSAFQIPAFLLPPPKAVVATLLSESHLYAAAGAFTARNALLGGALGVIGGVTTALLLAGVRPLRWVAEPYLTIFQSFPREALLPLFVVWIGFGPLLKIASSAMLCYFPTAMLFLRALLNTRADYLALLKSWGASDLRILLSLRLPYAVPSLTSVVKLAIPLSLIGSVLGEFMGGNDGIGHLMMSSSAAFRVDRICAGIVVLCFLGVIGASFVNLIERLLLNRFFEEEKQ